METKVRIEINNIKDFPSVLKQIMEIKEKYPIMSNLSLEVIVKGDYK